LMFINNFNVPFDNNIAERNIRSIKTKKKVSGQSKTIAGARNYVTLHSIVQTCNIRKMNTLKTIEAILNDEDPFNCFS
ncbi:MAG: IS66 family transposase, partial [Bacilli bacterium]